MRPCFQFVAGFGVALLIGGGAAAQQQAVGTPVDRNVADTGANAASQRAVQPGLGQFGVGSLLLDRFGDSAFEPTRHDGYHDPRANQRYLLQAQGVHALIGRPDYIGPSPQGGWVRNRQTFDGAEVMTMTAANTVYVLSPELLRPVTPAQPAYEDNPYRVQRRLQPTTFGDPYALMRETQVTGQPRPQAVHRINQRPSTYRHPEIIERQRKLREEREAERVADREQPDESSSSESNGPPAGPQGNADAPAAAEPEEH